MYRYYKVNNPNYQEIQRLRYHNKVIVWEFLHPFQFCWSYYTERTHIREILDILERRGESPELFERIPQQQALDYVNRLSVLSELQK